LGLGLVVAATGAVSLHLQAPVHPVDTAPPLSDAVTSLGDGWDAQLIMRLPEPISAIASYVQNGERSWVVFGTGDHGSVFECDLVYMQQYTESHQMISREVGETGKFGMCAVNTLACIDMDQDGVTELFASTCQIVPMSRPRTFVWSSFNRSLPVPRAVARPAIQSSWSHGLGLTYGPDGQPRSLVGTYCGYGEIVEFRLLTGRDDENYDALSWRVIGQLPASGEQTLGDDVDNDGKPDVCMAVGFAEGKASIHVFEADTTRGALPLKRVIDEDGKFSNVRFVVGPTREDGLKDLVAWWTTDHLQSGHIVMVRYRLDADGVASREVLAEGDERIWPVDGGAVVFDSNEDGRPEIWFGSVTGELWRLEPGQAAAPTLVAHFRSPLGPLLARARTKHMSPCLFICHDRDVVRLQATGMRSPVPVSPGAGDRQTVSRRRSAWPRSDISASRTNGM
jgi:hypothetical protein